MIVLLWRSNKYNI